MCDARSAYADEASSSSSKLSSTSPACDDMQLQEQLQRLRGEANIATTTTIRTTSETTPRNKTNQQYQQESNNRNSNINSNCSNKNNNANDNNNHNNNSNTNRKLEDYPAAEGAGTVVRSEPIKAEGPEHREEVVHV